MACGVEGPVLLSFFEDDGVASEGLAGEIDEVTTIEVDLDGGGECCENGGENEGDEEKSVDVHSFFLIT